MKKTIFTILAAASIVACTKSDVVDVLAPEAIAFDNAFVDNATKAIDATLNTNTLTTFNVYGTVTGTSTGEGTVNIFKGVEVKKGTAETGAVTSGNWWYSGTYTQYWIAGNAYKFAAVVNGTANLGDYDMPTTLSYNAEAQSDLLYAEHSVDSYAATTESDVVKFTFDHLLAKAYFTFQNTMISNVVGNVYAYKISDVKITNAYKAGTYTIADKKWAVTTGDDARYAVQFGNISNASVSTDGTDAVAVGAIGTTASATSHNQMLLIPNKYTDMVITCKVETLLNGTVIDTEETHTITPSEINLEAGKAYNFIFTKGNPGETIKFSVAAVTAWDETHDNYNQNL